MSVLQPLIFLFFSQFEGFATEVILGIGENLHKTYVSSRYQRIG